ncbi:MAG: hypothetical protein ACRDV1_03360 [Actinomycetes bacterium]
MTRPRAIGAVVVACLALTAAVVVAGQGGQHGRDPAGSAAAATDPSGTPTPLPVPDPCSVEVAGVTVGMDVDEARTLTAATARLNGTRGAMRAMTRLATRTLAEPPEVAGPVAASLLGQVSDGPLTCSHLREDVDPEEMGPRGLTPRAQRLRRAWTREFGALPAGGFARGGVTSGHVDNSAHYEGRAIDVFFRPHDDARVRRDGWVFAQWLVAHADDYHVLSVIYADRIWTSWASVVGWREYVHPSGNRRNPVLRHLDHVHVAVESGRPWRPYDGR